MYFWVYTLIYQNNLLERKMKENDEKVDNLGAATPEKSTNVGSQIIKCLSPSKP